MKRYCVSAILLLGWSVSASAMPSAEFVSRWHAASHVSKDVGAEAAQQTFANSPELHLLVAEFNRALEEYRGQVLAARAAGATPRSCPPKDVDFTIDGVIADIQKLPAGWQARELSSTFGEAMDRRFPCDAGHPTG